MKYILLTISVFLFVGIFCIKQTKASFLIPPFGGQVTSTTKDSVICQGGTGPVAQQSAGSSPQGDYFYPAGSKPAPQKSKWVLGLYSSVPSFSDCYRQIGPYRIPYPVLHVKLYGISR